MEGQNSFRSVRIVYGTETGTSQDLAKEFIFINQKYLRIESFQDIAEISQLNSTLSQSTLWIFFISTTGQGDFPYSMRPLWKKMLTKTHPLLTGMKFTIFSLGDRSYGDNFCMAARKFRQRLISLHAQEAVEIGLGDEQEPNGYFYEYKNKWYPNLFEYLNQNNMWKQQEVNQTKINLTNGKISQGKSKGQSDKYGRKENQFQLRIKKREEVCSNKDRRVFTLDVQIYDYPHKVELGDILSVYPANNPDHVAFLMKYFALTNNQIYQHMPSVTKPTEFTQSSTQAQLNAQSTTFEQTFISYINISSTLNHSFFISRSDLPDLSNYTENPLFKDKLQELAQSYDQYHSYIKKYKRNVIELIQDFQITNLPIHQFISRSSPIVSRKYSIAQVLYNQPSNTVIRILFKLAKKDINQNRVHHGICTQDLGLWSQLEHAKRCSILKGQFEYREKPVNNIVLITLGTGIAPFMQFLDQAKNSKNEWNLILFYTNRYQNEVYFQSLLQDLTASYKLNSFLSFTAEGGKRISRLVEDNCQAIRDMIEKVGLQQIKLMVCGPKEVCEGMENILGRELNVDMKLLKKTKIFVYENW